MGNENFPNEFAENNYDRHQDTLWDYRELAKREGRVRARVVYYLVYPRGSVSTTLATTRSEKMAAFIVEIHNAGLGVDEPKGEEAMGHG